MLLVYVLQLVLGFDVTKFDFGCPTVSGARFLAFGAVTLPMSL
jgi:hypothetical protein